MNKKNIAIISLNFVLPLLLGGSFVHAATSVDADNGNITPSISSIINFTGDKEQFKEDYLAVPNAMGGVSDFNAFKEYKNGDSVRLDGRAVAGSDDYLINYDFKRAKVGELKVEFKQFRKYFDGTGGFHSSADVLRSPVNFSEIDRDLFLDIGDFKVDAIVAKDDMPKCTFSYERKYRTGTESLLAWNSVVAPNGLTYKILPSFRELDDTTDMLRMKVEHSVQGFDVSVEQAWEKVHTKAFQNISETFNLLSGLITSGARNKDDNVHSDAYTTTMRVSKECSEKIFVSTDLLFNHYQGHSIQSIVYNMPQTAANQLIYPENPGNVRMDTVTLLPKASIQLLENLLMDVGLRWEWDQKDGMSNYNQDIPIGGPIERIVNIQTRTGENHIGESLGLKYDGIKNVRVYGDIEFEQQIRRQMEFQSATLVSSNQSRDADVFYYDYNSKVGFKWYPVPKVNITTEFEQKFDIRDWANDSQSDVTGNLSTDGYRGFLDTLWFKTYRPIILANFKPFKWLSCNLRYCLDTTYYGVRTPLAVDTEINKYIANTYSTSVTLTPRDYLYMTFYYQMRNAFTKTQANGDGGGPYNLPTFNNNVDTLSTVCSYSPVKDSTIRGSYSLSRAENFDDYSAITTGFRMPLAKDNLFHNASLEFEQKVREYCSISFKYNFMQYAEDSNNHMNDYIAHFLSASLKTKF